MTHKASRYQWIMRSVMVSLVLALAMGGIALAAEDAKFTAVEKDGAKVWDGGGTVDLKGRAEPLTLQVTNTLGADHGFSIDSMKVQDVIKAGETKTITVPLANIDASVSEHRVYCQLHPKHVAAKLTTTR